MWLKPNFKKSQNMKIKAEISNSESKSKCKKTARTKNEQKRRDKITN